MVVSDPRIAKDLMSTYGAVFSDRKQIYIKSQTIFVGGRGITVSPYNELWWVKPLPAQQGKALFIFLYTPADTPSTKCLISGLASAPIIYKMS